MSTARRELCKLLDCSRWSARKGEELLERCTRFVQASLALAASESHSAADSRVTHRYTWINTLGGFSAFKGEVWDGRNCILIGLTQILSFRLTWFTMGLMSVYLADTWELHWDVFTLFPPGWRSGPHASSL